MGWQNLDSVEKDFKDLIKQKPATDKVAIELRVAAYALDIFILSITLVIGWLIWSAFAWRKGTTPGHQLLKQKIVDEMTGETFSWGKMALRELVIKMFLIGFGMTFTFGLLWLVDALMIFRADQRTLHDMLIKSKVVAA